ncbi:MAG: hypothetical protein AAF600_15405 [Bacteroidota bacterium]
MKIKFFAVASLILSACFSQEKYKVQILVEGSIEDLHISVDNGIELDEFMVEDSMLIISDYFTTESVSVEISHPKKDNTLPVFTKGFFVGQEEAKISIKVDPFDLSPIKVISIEDAMTFEEMGSTQIDEYAQSDLDNFWRFYNHNIDKLGRNDSITQKLFEYRLVYTEKLFQAIILNYTTYYALWQFRRQIAYEPNIDRRRKEQFMEEKLGAFENTYDYQLAKMRIYGSQLFLGEEIPHFSFTDFITNRQVTTKTIKKPLLIVSWATWCGPCIKKLERMNGLMDKTPHLSVLYMNYDKDIERAKKRITSLGLKGYHLSFLDNKVPAEIENTIIPRMFLFGENLTLLYNLDDGPDDNLERLQSSLDKDLSKRR